MTVSWFRSPVRMTHGAPLQNWWAGRVRAVIIRRTVASLTARTAAASSSVTSPRSEYRDPREFFARTYLTDGLSNLLIGAAKRLSGAGGDPVVELQTNFGGGKRHSMLALYHMVGGTPAEDLPGLDQLLSRRNCSRRGWQGLAVEG